MSSEKEILLKIDVRNKARAEQDWVKADEMRNQLANMGIILDDTSDGTVWKKK